MFTNDLGHYLGFPIFKGRVRKDDFNFMIDKLHCKLAGWKSSLLNKPARLTLFNSVLASVPIYYLQNAWLPEGISGKIDAITRNFLWQSHPSKTRSLSLVRWNEVTKQRRWGGLGGEAGSLE